MSFDVLLTRSPLEWAMIVAGFVVLGVSGYVLRAKRFRKPLTQDAAKLEATLPAIGTVSEPTRLLVATAGLLLGYHLVIWAFPVSLTPIQAPREYWWVIVTLVAIVVVSSIVFDRAEQRRERS